MIKKYDALTNGLGEKREELDKMEEEEIRKIEQMIKEEEQLEVDADKVVDYLLNLIAYLNEEDGTEDGIKIIRKSMLNTKDLLKQRFMKAGFTNDVMTPKGYAQSEKDLRNSHKRSRFKSKCL
jgi:hypothetical protein